MKRALGLEIRTPRGVLVETEVERLVAEDRDGWFGVWPGRLDLLAVLPPGLLHYEDAQGEMFVAVDAALLELRAGRIQVLTQVAHVSRDLDGIADEVAARLQRRRERVALQRTVLEDLAMEARRRLVRRSS